MLRLYILPIERNGNARGPKYFPWKYDPDPIPALADTRPATMDFGGIDMCLVAVDVTTAQNNALAVQTDVIAVPQNLDNQVNGNLTAVADALETLRIPSGWVQTTDTYRSILRTICGMFLYMQRVSNPTTMTRNQYIEAEPVGNLPVAFRNLAQSVATAQGWDLSSVTLSTTWGAVWTLVYNQVDVTDLPPNITEQQYRLSFVDAFLNAMEVQIDQDIYTSGITLNTAYSDMPILWRYALRDGAETLGYDTSGLSGVSTLRDILKAFADEWTDPILLGPITL